MKRILCSCVILFGLTSLADMTMSEATEQSKIFFKAKKYDLAYQLSLQGSQEDGELLANLGCMYYEGKGCKKDVEKAIECWLAGEAKGNPRSIRYLAVHIDFPKKDYVKAQARLEKAAKAKESGANFHLGWMYEKGMATGGQDQQKAMEFYRIAALECAEPDTYILSYFGRKLYEIDPVAGVRVMKKAAAENNPWALFFLGVAYNSGRGGLPKDYLKAEECFRLAVEHAGNGHYKEYAVRGLNAIIKMCEEGLVVGDAGKKVIECLNQILNTTTASMKDRIYAYERLGDVYERGENGVSKDLIKALDYYKNADSGYSWYRSGVVYTDTKMKDLSKAVECFQKSVARNYGRGAIMLARNYIDNEKDRGGVQKAETVLRQMREKCARDEDLVCELLNVLELQRKYGDMKSLCIEAKKLIANCPRINKKLLSLLDKNVGVSKSMIDLKSVEDYMIGLSEKGDGDSSYDLSCYYRNGVLGLVDEKKADDMMERAAQQENPYALVAKADKESDDKKAYELLQKALEKDPECIPALSSLTMGCMSGRWGAITDVARYIKRAADTGDLSSCLVYGVALSEARLMPELKIKPDFKEACKYLAMASKDADIKPMAEIHMANLVFNSNSQDLEEQRKAFKTLKKHAEDGYFHAMMLVSTCYLKGLGCEKNIEKSDEWHQKVISFKGDPRMFSNQLHKDVMDDYLRDRKRYLEANGKIEKQGKEPSELDKKNIEQSDNKMERKEEADAKEVDGKVSWYGGLWRGTCTTVLAPGNIVMFNFRWMIFPLRLVSEPVESTCDIFEGCYYCVQDISLGLFDMLSMGWLGDEYFYNESSWDCKPSIRGHLKHSSQWRTRMYRERAFKSK